MSKALVIGGIVLVVVFVSAVAFLVLVYPQMTATPVVPVITPPVQTTTPKTAPPVIPPPATIDQIKLTITSPVDKAVVTTPTITVTGDTVPNANVAINELELKANAAGKFSAKLTLSEGDNPIVINAIDANGNYSEKELTVTYQPAT